MTPKAMRFALEDFQKISKALNDDKKSKALDHAYAQAMERIECQEAGFQELAKQVLLWITSSKRPLTTFELLHALAVEISAPRLDEDNFPELEDVVSVCASLVTIDKRSDIIRLVHYTTQEYFERTQDFWFPHAQRGIATTCLTYLSFHIFETGACPSDKEFEKRLRSNVLYSYAAKNWGYHAHAALNEVKQLVLDFFESERKVSASCQAMMASKSYSEELGYSQEVPKQMIGVHLAAYFGLEEVMIILLKNRHYLDSKDTYGQTPLFLAARNGHEAIVKLLVERNDVEADLKDNWGRTPLLRAAKEGHEVVVELLLMKRVDTDSKDENGRTPLASAAESGHEAVVKLLLATKRVNVDSKDVDGYTPLSWAAKNGHEEVVRLLVTERVDTNSKDAKYGRTPLLWAAENGHEVVVKLLLATKRVNVDSKDVDGYTPLSWAAKNGHEGVVRLLLAVDGIDVNSDDDGGRTALSLAAKSGHEAVAKLLLAKGADVNSRDKFGRTPLIWAAKNGHEAVIKLLLAIMVVDADSKDACGQTPLPLAILNGHKAMVKLLLATGGIEPDTL